MSNRQLGEDWQVSYQAAPGSKSSLYYARNNSPSWIDARDWLLEMIRQTTGHAETMQALRFAEHRMEFHANVGGNLYALIREPISLDVAELVQ